MLSSAFELAEVEKNKMKFCFSSQFKNVCGTSSLSSLFKAQIPQELSAGDKVNAIASGGK